MQGATFSISPFLMHSGNNSDDPEVLLLVMVMGNFCWFEYSFRWEPNGLVQKRAATEIARQQAETDKARLDFELVRLLKCGEAYKSGVMFHPEVLTTRSVQMLL